MEVDEDIVISSASEVDEEIQGEEAVQRKKPRKQVEKKVEDEQTGNQSEEEFLLQARRTTAAEWEETHGALGSASRMSDFLPNNVQINMEDARKR